MLLHCVLFVTQSSVDLSQAIRRNITLPGNLLQLVNDAQSFCVLAGRSIGNTHLSHIKRTVPREASCVLQFRDCLSVQPFLYVCLAKQEMSGREAWIDLQYFTALLNCFVVSAGPVITDRPPTTSSPARPAPAHTPP